MQLSSKIQDGLIAALATPLGTSALAIIRTSGSGCIDTLAQVFSRPAALKAAAGHTLVYGFLQDQDPNGEKIDEIMISVFRAPKSYTGEEMAELYCHGSIPGLEKIFSLLFSIGFRKAEGGEFTLRAFLNKKIDLSRAEAVNELVFSSSKTAQALALHRLGGAVENAVNREKQKLVKLMALVSVQLDYPEDEIDEIDFPREDLLSAREGVSRLISGYGAGRLYQEGVRLALAGRTNAGKSSLFNALIREERAIVSEIHGTTRDYIEAPLIVKGVPVRLFDTAGLRDVEEIIEKEGIRRSGMVIESAALVLYLIDGKAGKNAEDEAHINKLLEKNLPFIILWNKADEADFSLDEAYVQSLGTGGVYKGSLALSAKTNSGFVELLSLLEKVIVGSASAEDAEVLINSERQYLLLKRCLTSLDLVTEGLGLGMSLDLLALDLQDALQALGEITGEVTSEDILDAVFSGFCVGK